MYLGRSERESLGAADEVFWAGGNLGGAGGCVFFQVGVNTVDGILQ